MAMMEEVRLAAWNLTVFVGPDGGKRLSVEVGTSQNFENRLVVFLDADLEVLRVGIKDKFLLFLLSFSERAARVVRSSSSSLLNNSSLNFVLLLKLLV